MSTPKWDNRFLELAEFIAQWSKDPSTKVGAVIVDHDRIIIGTGYNGFPRGVVDDPDTYENRPAKYKQIVHAEANAIINSTLKVRGFTLYTTKFPCSECTKLIIQSGIARVITPRLVPHSSWAVDAEWSRRMMQEACVHLLEVDQTGAYQSTNKDLT